MTSEAFEKAAGFLVDVTQLTEPQARGTLRLGLKDGGLDPNTVTPRELAVVFTKLMQKRLEAQGVPMDEAGSICASIAKKLKALDTNIDSADPSSMFARLDKQTLE